MKRKRICDTEQANKIKLPNEPKRMVLHPSLRLFLMKNVYNLYHFVVAGCFVRLVCSTHYEYSMTHLWTQQHSRGKL